MILVTGATGHLGNVLVKALVERGEKVRALILPGENTSCFETLSIEIVEGDVRNLDSLRKAFKGIDYVFHLAGIVSISRNKIKQLEEVNIQGTRNILSVCREERVKRLVYTSSIHAFKNVPHGITIDETVPISANEALGAYGKSKAQATLDVLKAVKNGLDAVIVCPTGVIGPYDYKSSPMGRMLQYFLKQSVLSVPVGTYNFVDVRDIADGEIKACFKGHPGEIYILSGEQTSIGDYGRIMSFFTGRKIRLFYVPHWLCKMGAFLVEVFKKHARRAPIFTLESLEILGSNSRISCEKAQTQLGFSHRPLSDTVRDTILWLKNRKKIKGY